MGAGGAPSCLRGGCITARHVPEVWGTPWGGHRSFWPHAALPSPTLSPRCLHGTTQIFSKPDMRAAGREEREPGMGDTRVGCGQAQGPHFNPSSPARTSIAANSPPKINPSSHPPRCPLSSNPLPGVSGGSGDGTAVGMGWYPPAASPRSRQEGVSALLQGVATSYFHLWPRRASEDFTASSLCLPPPPSSTSRYPWQGCGQRGIGLPVLE